MRSKEVCRKLTSTRWLLLGLMVLAVVAFTSQPAYAQGCAGVELVSASGGLTLGQPGGIHVGNNYTTGLGVITNTSTCDGVGEGVTMGSTVLLVPACTTVPAPGTTCATPDGGVITVTSATSDIGTCGGNAAAITWTVGGGPGTFSLTAPSSISLAAFGACSIKFNYTVNTLPTVDANAATGSVLDTGGSIAATVVAASQNSAGGVGTTSTPFTFTCSALVDKQVSCDGGSTWVDQGLVSANNDSTNGCVGTVNAADIKVRYQAQNTSDSGIGLISCTIGESNVNLGPGVTSFDIANGVTTSFLGTSASALTCNSTLTSGEADTGSLDCTCNVPLATQPHATASDMATFGCCGIQVDKQVSCNGGGAVDPGFSQACSDVPTPAGCTATVGQSVEITYQIKNVGTVDATGCTITDANSGGTFYGPVAAGATITASGGLGPVVDNTTNPGTCTTEFSANEPNDAAASCSCGGGNLGTPVTVTADSCNKVTCTAQPQFTVSKTCTPQATAGNYDIVATVTNTDNTGGTTLSCTLTDSVFAGACPPSGSAISTVTLSSQPVTVGASGGTCDPATGTNCAMGTASGTLTGQTQATCDQVTATCTPSSGTLSPQTATAVCPFGSCFTRTPGYWGTHPNQTQAVINSVGGSLLVCGEGVTNVGLGVDSAIQNICESAQDAKKGKGNSFYTSTQQLQLIRQCTAAALNLAATGLGSTSAGETSCEGVSTGITADFNRCCGTGADSCNAGLKGTDIDTTGCIGILDTFNNKFDNVNFPSIYPNEAASSATCSAATGDGLTNCSSDSLGGPINCGKP